MRLTYETGRATFIQFVVLSLLNIGDQANQAVTGCKQGCAVSLLTSVVFYMLVVFWFAAVWVLGMIAQRSRNKRLAQLLIGAELLVIAVALVINIRHATDALSFITSFVDIVLAIWVIILAFRLMRAGTGRVVRTRQRRRPTASGQ
ncbi:MAG TPA: hypothetical protein VG604_02635 [Candidatus Saccharimonadales bacterium]|nr:hypothetical protein [Candidatus Saccharimonadales bacterium]